jgi:hypothetical protein
VAFLRDIEKLIRMTIPVSDRRANQRWAKPPAATCAFIKSPANAKRQRNRSGPARKQSRHGQSNEAPRGIDSAFIHGKDRPEKAFGEGDAREKTRRRAALANLRVSRRFRMG